MQNTERQDIYTRITGKIVASLEAGVRPWIRPWSGENAAGRITRPLRHNGVPYSGINAGEGSFKNCLHYLGQNCISFRMSKRSSGILAAIFAAAAGLILYECVPRKIEVNVIGMGRYYQSKNLDDDPGEIVRRYLFTDRGEVTVADLSPFHIGQKVSCVSSRNLQLQGYIHDCKPR